MINRIIIMFEFLLIFSTGYSNSHKFKTFQAEAKGVKIEINTQLELFHIMAYLSNSNYLNGLDFNYKSDINSYFELYKNDKSVQFIKKVLQGYNAHLSINGQFYDANFKNDTSYLRYLKLDDFGLPNTWGNKSTIIDSINKAVDAFAEISRFENFIENHKEYFQHKVEEVAKEISNLEMIRDFELFWGTKKDNYTIVISMLEKDIHAYWFTNSNKSECLFFLSPKFVVDNDAKFGNSDITNLKEGRMAAKDYIYYGAAHEIGHSFINPIMDKYQEQINQMTFLYSTPDPSKVNFLCESFLRSLTAHFLSKNKYEEFAQMVLQGEIQQGYVYNQIIVDLIKDYVNNCDNYKSFNAYAPVFLNRLKGLIEKK